MLLTVVDNVGAVHELVEDGIGLLGEVDLEADVVYKVVSFLGGVGDASWDRDDGDEVDEGAASFAVVDETGLALLVCGEGGPEVVDGLGGGVLAVLAFLDFAVRSLEEAAVAADNFVFLVTGEFEKGGRGIH